MTMLDHNWEHGDHAIVLDWFERELVRDIRHSMQRALMAFWEHHPDPTSESRMLYSLYEKGTCSFCRESVIRRLIELDSLSESIRAECSYDTSDEIRELVGADS